MVINLAPLKALFPNRGMLFVIAGLVLAVGWYLYRAEGTSDHLVKRNFNYLNEVASNINASAEAVTQVVPFNSKTVRAQIQQQLTDATATASEGCATQPLASATKPCPAVSQHEAPNLSDANSDRDTLLMAATESSLESLKTKLVKQGALIERSKDVQITISKTEGGANLLPHQSAYVYIDPAVSCEKFAVVSSIKDQKISIEADGIHGIFDMYMAVLNDKQGGRLVTSGWPDSSQNGNAEREEPGSSSPQCDSSEERGRLPQQGLNRATFEITIPFENIRGVASNESFFDALLIARSDGAGSEVLFANTELPTTIREHEIASLLGARSGFERINNIAEFELQNGRMHGPLDDTGRPTGGSATQVAFTQSSVIPVDIGGFSHLAFVQPFRSEYTEQTDLVLIGIVRGSTFNRLKYAVPYNKLSNTLLLLAVLVLSLNFFRLKLIRERGVLHRRDTLLSFLSMMGIASLTVVLLMHLLGSWQFKHLFNEDMNTLQEWIEEEFQQDLSEKLAIIRLSGRQLAYKEPLELRVSEPGQRASQPRLSGSCEAAELSVASSERAVSNQTVAENATYSCKATDIPTIATLYILDGDGSQTVGYASHSLKHSAPGFNVASRQYFRQIVRGDGWSWPGSAGNPATDFFMQRIENKGTGSMDTAISIPLADAAGTEGRVVVGLSHFRSLEATVLPPGFGFAVFERVTGDVLFHSSARRSLRENIFRATDDDLSLKAAVVTDVTMDLKLNYKGEKVEAIVSPLANTRWNLFVYHRKSIVDIVNFQFGITAFVLAFAYFVICLVALPGLVLLMYWLGRLAFVERLQRREKALLLPQVFYPMVALLPRYKKLAMALLLVVLVYIAGIYRIDLPMAFWLVLAPVLVIPVICILLLKGDATAIRATGDYLNPQFASPPTEDQQKARRDELTQTYMWYRTNVCFVVLLVAVLPTMLLHNENYDVREKLWVEFTNWSNINRLDARSIANEEYMSRMHTTPLPSGPDPVDVSWRGIYLPRTELYAIDADLTECSADKLRPTTLAERNPPWKEEPSRRDDAESTQYIEVARRGTSQSKKCRFVRTQELTLIPHLTDDTGHRRQSATMRRVIEILPSVEGEAALLDSFIADEDGDVGVHRSVAELEDVLQVRSLRTPGNSADTRFEYTLYNFFPHTRPIKWWEILGLYLGLALISGLIISILQGFLMRKFLSREFEEDIPSLVCNFALEDLHDGGIVIFPSGMSSTAAFAQFVSDMGLAEAEYCTDSARIQLRGIDNVALFDTRKLVVIKDFYSLIGNQTGSDAAIKLIQRKRGEGHCTVILTDIDLDHWLYHRLNAEDMRQQALHFWEALVSSVPTFMLPRWREDARGDRVLDDRAYQLPRGSYRRTWSRCSEDEQVVLLSLHYESGVNPRNEYTLRSLYRRRLIEFRHGHFEFGDHQWFQFIGQQMHRAEFRRVAARYKNTLWLAFRGPMVLILLVLIMFIAYVAQDELRFAFSLLGTVGAGAATLSVLGNRLRALTGQ